MFIAFEGPDQTGKSTSARNLDCTGQPTYNATKENHAENVLSVEDHTMPFTYDRIDWFSHMVYRLALPEKEWNDARPRTVFAMPDTHLVVSIHHPQLAEFLAPDEAVETPIGRVNPMYYHFADFFMSLNRERNYELFKTVSILEVFNDSKADTFYKRLIAFDSPAVTLEEALSLGHVMDDDALLELLRHEEQQRL